MIEELNKKIKEIENSLQVLLIIAVALFVASVCGSLQLQALANILYWMSTITLTLLVIKYLKYFRI